MSFSVVKRCCLAGALAAFMPALAGAQSLVDSNPGREPGVLPVAASSVFPKVSRDRLGVRLAAAARDRSSSAGSTSIREAARSYPPPRAASHDARKRLQEPVVGSAKGRKSVIGWAIAIGIGAGLAASAIAASKYGENEGGQFCGRCFMEWSAITVPAGAGGGALVGYLIDQSRQ